MHRVRVAQLVWKTFSLKFCLLFSFPFSIFCCQLDAVTFYTPFLQEVWEKKPEIEQAFHMEEPVTLDSGEGTLEHSTHHLPQPPPRHESYMLKNADGSGSENYEHLPTRSLSSLNGGDDNNINFNLNDNNEKYPHLYMLGEKDMGIDDSYLNDDDKDDKSRLIHQGN